MTESNYRQITVSFLKDSLDVIGENAFHFSTFVRRTCTIRAPIDVPFVFFSDDKSLRSNMFFGLFSRSEPIVIIISIRFRDISILERSTCFVSYIQEVTKVRIARIYFCSDNDSLATCDRNIFDVFVISVAVSFEKRNSHVLCFIFGDVRDELFFRGDLHFLFLKR
uniref:Uncharacterized protein n=1 Tax=Rhizobium phage LG08 TaxID=3129229 RepID=A0AAU8HYU0_9CAUD